MRTWPHALPATAAVLTLAVAVSGAWVAPSAHAASDAEKPFVGYYENNTAEATAGLLLLEDNSFCFAFSGGSLNMLAAGHWKAAPGGGIRLQEVRAEPLLFPARVRPGAAASAPAGTVVFDFQGHALSDAVYPVFAMSADEQPPTAMRPLFPRKINSWARSYPLPAVSVASARYFYVGDTVETTREGQPQTVTVTQYRLETAGATPGGDAPGRVVRVGFNRAHATPLLTPAAQFKDGVLYLEGDRFGKPEPITPELLQKTREGCIDPALKGVAHAPGRAGAGRTGEQALVPVKTFTLSAAVVQGAPYFEAKTGGESR